MFMWDFNQIFSKNAKIPKNLAPNVYSGNIWYRNRKWLVVRAVLPDIDVDFAKKLSTLAFLTKFWPKVKLIMTQHLLSMDDGCDRILVLKFKWSWNWR